MTGTNIAKVDRVIRHLATHPRHIRPYVVSGPLSSKTPLSLGLPWFSLSAIEFLDQFIRKEMHVFEYGSGGSTIFFALRTASVTSTEDEEAWLLRARAEVAARGINNVTLQHRSFDFHKPMRFEASDYLHSIPPMMFDIIVVDGKEESAPVRPMCFWHAESKIAKGGIIIVDDSWRYPELRTRNRASSFREFRSTGPCRPGVTSTDIYFY